MMYTSNIAVAEQQHVAWLLGYLCGIRPGSITVSEYNEESKTLSWGDIDIRRQLTEDGVWEGQFVATLNFRYLKQTADTSVDGKDLRMTILAPRTNPMLSLPHRLLVLCLRRGLLQRHSTVEELMLGREEKVLFKTEALSRPVLLATSSRGLTLLDRPAHSHSLTEYLRRRAQWLGYDGVTTFYAWRRKFGTQIERAAGADKARGAMAHSVASKVYEQYYDQGLYDLNNTSILIDKDNSQDAARAVTENLVSLALSRSVHIRQCKSRDRALATFVNSHTLVTDAIANSTPPDQVKQIKKRLRAKALDAMLRNEQAIQSESRTVDDIKSRIEELRKPSALTRMISKRIKEREQEEQEDVLAELLQQSQTDFRDAEEEIKSGDIDIASNIIIPDDEEEDADAPLPVSPKTATAFMELLVEFAPQRPTTKCSLCAASQWRTKEEQDHDWVDQTKLARHMDGREHTPYWEFRTKMTWLALHRADGKYFCPYGCNNVYETFRTLVRHIKESSKINDDAHHEQLKVDEGWYEDSWFGDKTISTGNNRPTKRERRVINEPYDERFLSTSKRRVPYDHPLLRDSLDDLYFGDDAGALMRESIANYTFVAPGGHSTMIMLEGMENFLVAPIEEGAEDM